MLNKLLTQLTVHTKLEKIAALVSPKAPTNEWAMLKAAVEDELFSWLKKAEFTAPFLKALGITTGIAVPAGLAANHLINKKRDATNSVIKNIAGTALGAGAVGLGLYGAHKFLGPNRKRASMHRPKNDTTAYECARKLAAVGHLDDVLCAELEKTANKQTTAMLLRINRAYGMQLLKEACDGGK